jgi:D-2-hydroxyacid dehydrogenase (NADP+)
VLLSRGVEVLVYGSVGLMSERKLKIVIGVDMAEERLASLRAASPDVDFVACAVPERLPDEARDADGMLIGVRLSPDVLHAAPNLRWLHSFSAGITTLLTPEMKKHNVILTNNSGVRSNNVAEHVVAMMLAFARGLPVLVRNQTRRHWEYIDYPFFEVRGQTLGIVGLGSIGTALAEKASGLGMNVLGMKRRPTSPVAGVDEVFGRDRLHEMLGQSDHVAICLPLTPATHHLFDDDAFGAMRAGSYIYNIGRGPIVDHDALVRALRSGHIAGAGLDVTEPEPLQEASPLWDMDNVLITCHTSQATPFNWERTLALVSENIGRLKAGQPLLNIVDKAAGY